MVSIIFERENTNCNCHSKYETLKYGVPQCTVLGPMLFSIYNSPIREIIEKHNIYYHLYADDGQLYLGFSPNDNDKWQWQWQSILFNPYDTFYITYYSY